ncbi:MAG: hypothetical protein ABIX28_25285, partial [Vicinamibacterales bacterium]
IDLNESGAVLGAIWDDDFTTTHALLSTVDGGVTRFERTSAAGLNNRGDVLLQDYFDGFLPRAWIRRADGTLDDLSARLTTAVNEQFRVADLNDRGDVVGFAPEDGGWNVFALWAGSTVPVTIWHVPADSRVLGSGYVYKVPSISSLRLNKNGLIVISLLHSEPSGPSLRQWLHDYLWDHGQLIDAAPGSETATVNGFNDRDEAIILSEQGQVLYRNGQRTSLDRLETPPAGGYTRFYGISNAGQLYGMDRVHTFFCYEDASQCHQRLFRWDPPLAIATHPVSLTITEGQSAQFDCATNGPPTKPDYRWQYSSDGGINWQLLAGANVVPHYSGTTTDTLRLVNVPLSFTGQQYRCVVTGVLQSVTSKPATLTVTPVAVMVVDKTSLQFAAVTNGLGFEWQTAPQVVRLAQNGPGAVLWTATANQPWLTVTPSSGSGPDTLTVAVVPGSGVPLAGTITGSIAVSFPGGTAGPIAVSLTTASLGRSDSPFGVIDTPTNNAVGVTGAIPMTGWALDDIEVTGVTICRAAVAPEVASVDGRCGNSAKFFVGAGVFIDGARPDVQTAYPTYPRNSAAGWGFMILTNMLPNKGNGTYVFSAYASDREGHVSLLGTRTMTCANAAATTPFGTIDTPEQGQTVSGSQFVNFGWALTQNPKLIPFDGATMRVYIDGVAIGAPSYNHFRSDIAALFPGLANSAGAVGFKIIDTTALANGLHTIVWTATDSAGIISGLGSRFFRVVNSLSPAAPPSPSAMDAGLATVPIDTSPVVGRRGWDPDSPWRVYPVERSGRSVLRGEEVDRVQIELGDHAGQTVTGFLRVGEQLSPLPIGSRLDSRTGAFAWSPGAGFVGTYDFLFLRSAGERMVARREVRVILQSKGSGRVGAQVVIDAPRSQQDVDQPFAMGGWAADLDAQAGTGIDTLHVWAYPLGGGPPVFLGAATYGGPRPDVAAVHGDQFHETGWGLTVQGLEPGNYDLAVFAWSSATAGFLPAVTARVAIRYP